MLPATAQHWWASTPPISRGALVLLVAVFLVTGLGTHAPCFSPLLPQQSMVQFLMAPWCHSGLLHILFNVWAGWTQLSSVERAVGSSGTLVLILVLAYGCEVAMIPAAMIQSAFLPALPHSCVLGFSGALFGLLAIECFGLNPNASVSLCGCVAVPARWSPLALWALCGVVFPAASGMAHLAGILLGWFVVRLVRRDFLADAFGLAPCIDVRGSAVSALWVPAVRAQWGAPFAESGVVLGQGQPVAPPLAAPGIAAADSTARGEWKPFSGPGRTLGSTGSIALPAPSNEVPPRSLLGVGASASQPTRDRSPTRARHGSGASHASSKETDERASRASDGSPQL